MGAGTSNVKKPRHGPEGGVYEGAQPEGQYGGPYEGAQPGGQNGGQYPITPPQMVTGGPYGPGPGGVPNPWGQPGQQQPTPDQMEEWKKQFGNWNPGQGNPPPNWNPGQGQPGQFPGGYPPGLLAGGGQPGQNMPPRFPGYDPNAQKLPPKTYV